MTATFETAPCPPGAICTPQGRDHVVSYAFGVERASSPRRPFVVHADVGGVDVCLEVMIELEIRTRMPHRTGGSGKTPAAEVNLHPRIDFEACGTYFRTDKWLGARAGLRARQELLHQFHEEIVRAFGGENVIEGWKKLGNVPAKVTVLGARVEDVRKFVNKKLAELGVPGGNGHSGPNGPNDHDDHGAIAGSDRRARRSKNFRMKPFKRRGPVSRSAVRRQTSKSKTPSRAR